MTELFDTASPRETSLSGSIVSITFRNERNGYTVARLETEDTDAPVTVVGPLPSVAEGDPLRLVGDWVEHPHYGRQFSVERCEIRPPSGRKGLVKFLGGGRIKGVGPKTAEKIVDALGLDVLDRLEREPTLLATVAGISDARAGAILEQLATQRAASAALVFLQDHGLGPGQAARVFERYGDATIERVRENPYRLAADILGIGFRIADGLALSLGFERDAAFRVSAGLAHQLGVATQEGHVGLPFDDLVAQAAELLGVDAPRVEEVLVEGIRDEAFVEDELVYRPDLWRDETSIAEDVRRLLSGAGRERPSGSMLGVPVSVAGPGGPIELASDQREALRLAISSQLSVVTGGPGVGKTTIVRCLVELFANEGMQVALAAPTGRAARRLGEATGAEASTLHRLLGITPETFAFRHGREEPLALDALIVDETSMVDVPLMAALMRALPPHACLVLVGDVDQLPSVGPGEVLRSFIESGTVPVGRLTTIFRQAASSGIVRVAHELNAGRVPAFDDSTSGQAFFIERSDPAAVLDAMVRLVSERIPERFGLDAKRDVQVITPMHAGPLGTNALNDALREVLNPAREGCAEITRFGRLLREGDKVMQVRNNYDVAVFNGDIGVLEALDPDSGQAWVLFDGRRVEYTLDGLDQIEPAFAITCHKSQGSEFPAIVLPVVSGHFIMLRRNLVYTAFTRAKQVLCAVGEPRALETAVRQVGTGRRHTRLAARLRGDA